MATHEKLQYTVIHKILCQCRKANDNNVTYQALCFIQCILNSYLLLQQITTWVTFTSHEKFLNTFSSKNQIPLF